MATITATKTGNWSDTTVWDLARAPLDGDTVLAVTYTITFDVDVNQANTTLNATSGNFRYSSAGTRNVTANANVGNHSTTGLIQNTSTGTLNFTGAITGGNGSYAYGANNASSGTITITTCTGGNGSYACGAHNASNGTITITTCTGGSGGAAYGASELARPHRTALAPAPAGDTTRSMRQEFRLRTSPDRPLPCRCGRRC